MNFKDTLTFPNLKRAGRSILGRLGKAQDSIFIFDASDFKLRGCIFEKEDEKVFLKAEAISYLDTPSMAIKDVIDQLRDKKISIPKKGLLLTDFNLVSGVSVPSDALDVSNDAQIDQLVRWDMESLVSEKAPLLTSIGRILTCKGYIDDQQRDLILDEIKSNEESVSGPVGLGKKRFGEIAIEKEILNGEQLEECIAIQSDINTLLLDNEIDFSYRKVKSNTEESSCITCTMSAPLRDMWISAFGDNDIQILSISPKSLTALNPFKVSPDSDNKKRIFLEIDSAKAIIFSTNGSEISEFKCLDFQSTPLVDEIVDLINEFDLTDYKDIFFHYPTKENGQFIEDLQNIVHSEFHDVTEIRVDNFQIDETATSINLRNCAALIGLAYEYFSTELEGFIPTLDGHPPPPPIYKNYKFQVSGMAVFFMALILSFEIYSIRYASNSQVKIDDLNTEAVINEDRNEKLEKRNSEIKIALIELEELESKKKTLEESKKVIESVLISRQKFIQSFLPSITQSAPDDLILLNIEETSWYELKLTGWSSNQNSIEDFNRNLSNALSIWDLNIVDNKSRFSTDMFDSQGYKFEFLIAKKDYVEYK